MVGGQRHVPAALPPGKTRYPFYRRLGGPQDRSGRVRKISPPTGIRSLDRPAHNESLYRLSYPGPRLIHIRFLICTFLIKNYFTFEIGNQLFCGSKRTVHQQPQWAKASLFGITPLDEWSAHLYLTTHNTHNRQTSMPPAGFKPAILGG